MMEMTEQEDSVDAIEVDAIEVDAIEEAAALRVAIVRIQRRLRARSGPGITPSQSSALARIEQEGPFRLGTLADREGTTAATMSRVIDNLSAGRLIERVPDPLDGRASLVQLSPEGGALLHRLRADYTEALREVLAKLDPEERRVVRQSIPVLARLSDLLQSSDDLQIS